MALWSGDLKWKTQSRIRAAAALAAALPPSCAAAAAVQGEQLPRPRRCATRATSWGRRETTKRHLHKQQMGLFVSEGKVTSVRHHRRLPKAPCCLSRIAPSWLPAKSLLGALLFKISTFGSKLKERKHKKSGFELLNACVFKRQRDYFGGGSTLWTRAVAVLSGLGSSKPFREDPVLRVFVWDTIEREDSYTPSSINMVLLPHLSLSPSNPKLPPFGVYSNYVIKTVLCSHFSVTNHQFAMKKRGLVFLFTVILRNDIPKEHISLLVSCFF